jgi:hypothetical protein
MRLLITFGGAAYDEITEQVVRDATGYGVDAVWVYDDVWLDKHPFRQLNSWLWEPTKNAAPGRGYGWYAWKPLVILDALDRALHVNGDEKAIVLFVDADTRPIADLTPIYEYTAREGAMLFAASAHKQWHWCKRDCYEVMGESIDQLAPAGVARFMAFGHGWKQRQFLYEWLTYCVNRRATTFEPSTQPELTGFEEHRTEQAIMTLLARKYGYPLHREACEAGNEYIGVQPGNYPQLFVQKHLGGPHPLGKGSRFGNMR